MTDIDIPLKDIDIPTDRARDLDLAWVDALASLFTVQGQINAITVRKIDTGFRLVTGLHRHGAATKNDWPTIRARISTAANDDEARLEEVMENLGRNDLNALDRAHHLYELKQTYERLYPERKHGGDRKSEIKRQKLPLDPPSPEIFGFVADTAEKIGLSERAIRMAVSIWKGLTVASRARAAGTWLADHQSSLKLLSAQTPAYQKAVLDCLFSSPPTAANVAEALIIIENGRAPSHVEKKFASLNKALTGLKDEELDSVLSIHEERIVSWVKRKGLL
ncbi:ParB N-terminal domain-containing protein [Pararhizobium gei]|uniref:ParB N-terminal domain-containing protein n=1 Tax=Pararhizobium gei TaxID=1395951 RepID=UPI0023D9B52F|nr:ParB N-terminal domain-containing protein [Rhizobium gei]